MQPLLHVPNPSMHMPPPRPHLPPEPNHSAPPHYHKLSFPTYDGKEDPLGWLNRCDRFFRAQRTPEGDKVWLTSFHLTGTAQQWYYVLEHDSDEPAWDEFKLLCHQRFGPPLRSNHLADLARLPFPATVAAYQDAFQARMVHAGCLTPYQQAQLFTDGLPEHIRIDVEFHDHQDLQRAMSLACAYDRRNVTPQLALPAPSPRIPRRRPAALPAPPPLVGAAGTTVASSSSSTPPPPWLFKRLTPAEMADRRKLGLCYNCDEPYVRGHKCPHLFYLEVSDYVVKPDDEATEPEPTEELVAFDPDTPMISSMP